MFKTNLLLFHDDFGGGYALTADVEAGGGVVDVDFHATDVEVFSLALGSIGSDCVDGSGCSLGDFDGLGSSLCAGRGVDGIVAECARLADGDDVLAVCLVKFGFVVKAVGGFTLGISLGVALSGGVEIEDVKRVVGIGNADFARLGGKRVLGLAE